MIQSIAQKGEQVKGFYSPAKKIDLGNCYLIFVSGIQASKTDADISEQTHEVFDVIGSILENAGATFDEVVKAVKKVAGNTPFIMEFTFGEYGFVDDGNNTTGGLMLSFTAYAN